MLNKVILMGRLCRDPDVRYTQNNTPVASFTLAVDRGRKTEGQPDADFFDIVAWGKKADFVHDWFSKGQLVAVTGRLQRRDWQDKHGNKRTTYEVVAEETHFAEGKKDRPPHPAEQPEQYNIPDDGELHEMDDDDGEVPF